MLVPSFASLALVVACAASTSDSDAARADREDAFFGALCVDAGALADDSFQPDGLPAGAVRAAKQHIKVGTCEAYLAFFFDRAANQYWESLATNCTMNASVNGVTSPNAGYPADCFVKQRALGPVDSASVTTVCVCCIGGYCGRACRPRPFDGGGGLICGETDSDFRSGGADNPQNRPEVCDCSGF